MPPLPPSPLMPSASAECQARHRSRRIGCTSARVTQQPKPAGRRTRPVRISAGPVDAVLPPLNAQTALSALLRIVATAKTRVVPTAPNGLPLRGPPGASKSANPTSHLTAPGQGLCPRRGLPGFRSLRALPSRVIPLRGSPLRARGTAPSTGRIEAPLRRPHSEGERP